MGITETLVEYLAIFPPAVGTIILAALPIGELRVGLPVALLVYKMPVGQAFVLSLIGNMLPVYFLLLFFERASEYARLKSPAIDRFLAKLIDRTQRKLGRQVDDYGVWALAAFVAVPLPVTGAWTGVLAAFVFGLSKPKASLAIFLGLIVSASIVTALTLGTSFTVKALLGL